MWIMLKMPVLLNHWNHQAGGESANSLKSWLHNPEHGFRALESAKMNKPKLKACNRCLFRYSHFCQYSCISTTACQCEF